MELQQIAADLQKEAKRQKALKSLQVLVNKGTNVNPLRPCLFRFNKG